MNKKTPTFGFSFGGLVLFATTAAILFVLAPYWRPIFWAVVFTILFWPLRMRLAANMKGGANAAAVVILLVILFAIVVPALIIAGLVADGAATVVTTIRAQELEIGTILKSLQDRFPEFSAWLQRIGLSLDATYAYAQKAVSDLGKFAAVQLSNVGQGASAFVFQLFIFFYLTYSFLRMGSSIYRNLFEAVPLETSRKQMFFEAFAEMSTATIKGMIAVGLVQGAMGAIAFAILGIPGPVFWGALMAILSIIPPFGAGFIWAPAAVYLLVTGNFTSGIGLLIWGGLFISMSDNIVRPAVVGRSTSMPDYMVLIATLGGLASFGLTGLVLGPVIGALFLAGWQGDLQKGNEGAEGT